MLVSYADGPCAVLRLAGAVAGVCALDDAEGVEALRVRARGIARAALGDVTLRREPAPDAAQHLPWTATHLVCARSELWREERRAVVRLEGGVAWELGTRSASIYCDRSGWTWRDRAKRLAVVRVVRVVDLATCEDVALDRYPRRAAVRMRVEVAVLPGVC